MFSKLKITKTGWLVVAAAVFGYIISAIVAIIGLKVPWWTWIMIGFGALCTLAVTIYMLYIYGKESESKTRRLNEAMAETNKAIAEDKIGDILWLLSNEVPGKVTARANVMLIDENEQLYIAYHEGMDGAADLGLRWGKYVGCCGHVWATGKQAFANFNLASEKDLEITWKMDEEHRARTKKVKSLASVPIQDIDNPDIIIGVLSCDSSEPLSVSRLNERAFLTMMRKYGELIAGLLKLGDIPQKGG